MSQLGALELKNQELQTVVLPTLLKLLNEESDVREETPLVLGTLISSNEDLQRAACDVDAVSRLVGFLKESKCSNKLKKVRVYDFFGLFTIVSRIHCSH